MVNIALAYWVSRHCLLKCAHSDLLNYSQTHEKLIFIGEAWFFRFSSSHKVEQYSFEATMNKISYNKQWLYPLISGLTVALLCIFFSAALVFAQDGEEPEEPVNEIITTSECQECHLDISNHWENSPHANAYVNEAFQEKYTDLGEPVECLACHTTGFNLSTGSFDQEGVACESCHGAVKTDHPPEPVPLLAD